MRRLNKERLLDALNKIEALTSESGKDNGAIDIGLPGIDGEALNLMVKVARRKDGVKLLVERYAASPSLVIVGALDGILTRHAETTKLKDAYLLFEFIEKLHRRDNFGVLVTTLTAVKFQIGLAKVWQHTRLPESFYPFLQYCLDFTGERANWIHHGLSDDVQLSAIDVLSSMCKHEIYNLNFDEEQRRWLEDKFREIAAANFDNDSFQRYRSYFFDCLTNRLRKTE